MAKMVINQYVEDFLNDYTGMIERKTADYRVKHRERYDYGRFKIHLDKHRELVRANGYYIFTIRYDDGDVDYLISAFALDYYLRLSKRKTKTAGISTKWVEENCLPFRFKGVFK